MDRSLFSSALALSLVITSARVNAAEWQLANIVVGPSGRSATFVDAKSIRTQAELVRFKSELYLEHEADGYDRISTTSLVNCSTYDVTVLSATFYRGAAPVRFSGGAVLANHYSSADPAHWLYRRVCDRKFIATPTTDLRSFSDRMLALTWRPVAERLVVPLPDKQQALAETKAVDSSPVSLAAR